MNPFIQFKKAMPLFLVALACFALSPALQAVNPLPDGGYPNQNTAEGEDALFNLTIGNDNTAVGFHALFRRTAGPDNTAIGYAALSGQTQGSFNTAIGANALLNSGEAGSTGLPALLRS